MIRPEWIVAFVTSSLLVPADDTRIPVAPAAPNVAHQIVINEVMANPAAVTDDAGEWVEVHNTGSTAINLQGWQIVSDGDATHTIASSVSVPAGGYVVLARVGARTRNGGVVAQYVYGTGVNLTNSGDWLALRDAADVTIDSVAWSTAPNGASRGVRDPSADNTDVDGASWLTSTSTFGRGDRGTPGRVNDGFVAPPAPVASVTVTPATASVAVAATQQFVATARDANGNAVSTTFTWGSSNPAIASVSQTGLAIGVTAGSVTITAISANGVSGTATLTVASAPGIVTGVAELVVHVLDVGQGDATLIMNGTSRVLIDGGPTESRFGALLDSLGLNNTTFDYVILSHEHLDHHSGLRELFRTSRNITVRNFLENRNASTADQLGELRDSVTARAARGSLTYGDTDNACLNGAAICTITLNGGAKLHILKPNPSGSGANNRSTPLKLVGPDSASFTMWFAGDAERQANEWFDVGANYDVSPGMKVNVLKSNHHGSCNGITSRYAALTNPDLVTMSVGSNNSHDHVHNQTKQLWTARGKPWYRTDENGTITFRSAGTPGSGYTFRVDKGTARMNGASDGTAAAAECNPVP